MYWPDRSPGSAVSEISFEMPSSAREHCFHCNDHYHHYYSFELLSIPESIIILMIIPFPIIIIITLKDLWVPESLLHILLKSPLLPHPQINLGSKQREGPILFNQSQGMTNIFISSSISTAPSYSKQNKGRIDIRGSKWSSNPHISLIFRTKSTLRTNVLGLKSLGQNQGGKYHQIKKGRGQIFWDQNKGQDSWNKTKPGEDKEFWIETRREQNEQKLNLLSKNGCDRNGSTGESELKMNTGQNKSRGLNSVALLGDSVDRKV